MQEDFNLFDSLMRGINEAIQDTKTHELNHTSYIHEEAKQEILED